MRILHTESSNGWGGQEIRILHEAKGMRERGYEIIMAVTKGGVLIEKARAAGFTVYEIDFKRYKALLVILQLLKILRIHKIDLINTHSSLDAWLGGIAARMGRKKIIRTRHLSTPIRKGLNSRVLYKTLADFVVTTSSQVVSSIVRQAKLSSEYCRLVATGVDQDKLRIEHKVVIQFRENLSIKEEDFLVGTACVVRSWKGIQDFINAAHILRGFQHVKWVVIGGGYVDRYKELACQLSLDNILYFVGHLDPPYAAIAACDVFALLSTANEGISQACLQAAYLEKPLITTTVGGLPEVCLNQETGWLVPPHSPEDVAKAVLYFLNHPEERFLCGKRAKQLVENKFTLQHTLDQMQQAYQKIF